MNEKTVFIGTSAQAAAVRDQVRRIARYEEPVLIVGETGVGKSLAAAMVHECSGRAAREFHYVNCAALAESTLMSELFGHSRGAFTGAHANRRGLIAHANGSTIVLDEVTETSATFQASLLHTVDNGEVRPVGADTAFRVDVRFVATTNCDPAAAAANGTFRFDLLQRLSAFVVSIPPLRERTADTRLLAEHFLDEIAVLYGAPTNLSVGAQNSICRLPLRGNARELRHLLLQAHASCAGDALCRKHVEAACASRLSPDGVGSEADLVPYAEHVRGHLALAIDVSGGNLTKAARLLKLPRSTLRHYLTKYGVVNRATGRAARA